MISDFDEKQQETFDKISEHIKNDEELQAFFKTSIKKRYPILKIFCLVIDSDKSMKVAEYFDIARVPVLFQFRAEGTASSETLDLLGLGHSSKTFMFCVAPEIVCNDLLMILSKKLRLKAKGNGIAFIVPISGAASHLMKVLDEETRQKIRNQIEGEVDKMRVEHTHELIFAVTNPGYSDSLMEAAKEAGAGGGTIIHARQIGREPSTKSWGITILGEKEVIAIITQKEKKVPIMKAINSKFGKNSEANGVIISVPVDAVEGLDDDDD